MWAICILHIFQEEKWKRENKLAEEVRKGDELRKQLDEERKQEDLGRIAEQAGFKCAHPLAELMVADVQLQSRFYAALESCLCHRMPEHAKQALCGTGRLSMPVHA